MLGSTIKDKRNKLDMSREDLASRMCVSVETIKSWESGKRRPGTQAINDLSDVLEIPVEILMNALKNSDIPRLEGVVMKNSINDKFKNLNKNEETIVFIEEILKDFKYDNKNSESIKNWLCNYLYAIILSELEYRDNEKEEDNIFDIYDLIIDLKDYAINELFDERFKNSFDKLVHGNANKRERVIARVYETYSCLEEPDNLRITLLNLAAHINKKVNNVNLDIMNYVIK